MLAATGNDANDDDRSIDAWLQRWVYSCPHQNITVEGMFNIMDAVAAVGGPRLGAVEKENRVKGLCSVVMSQRVKELSPKTGKPKQHHTTRANVQLAVDGAIKLATAYTADVAVRANGVPKRQLEDPLLSQQKAAAHSKPERRQPHDAAAVGRGLVVRAGTYCKR